MMESALIKIEKLVESIGDVAIKFEIGVKNSIAMFVS
jgi:hypothetical protein